MPNVGAQEFASVPPGTRQAPTPKTSTAVAAAASCVCAILATLVLLTSRGWPLNHEALAFLQRTEWFRRAFAAGDFFPTWSPFCFNGHGTPGPLLYPRLFNSLAAALAMLLGSSRNGVVAALILFLTLGGTGMARFGELLGWPVRLRLAAAALLVFAPYTFTDFLIRAALAETSAAMLVPWLLVEALRLVRGESRGVRLGAITGILFYAHPLIWMWSGIVLASAAVAALARARRRCAWERTVSALAIAAAIAVLLDGVPALAVHRVGHHFALEQFKIFAPRANFNPPKRYLTAPGFNWGHQWERYSVEISRGLLLALLVLVPLARALRVRIDRAAAGLLVPVLATCLALQLEVTAPIYETIPLLDMIQFPWRLLVFIVPATILLTCELAAKVVASGRAGAAWAARVVVLIALVSHVALAVRAQRIRYEWIGAADVEATLRDLDGPWSSGEFLPAGHRQDQVPPRAPFIRAEGCSVQIVSGAPRPDDLEHAFHFVRVELEVSAEDGCVVHFSQFLSPLVGVEGAPAGAVVAAPGGTIDVRLHRGTHRLALVRRSVWRALLLSGSAPAAPVRTLAPA